MKLLIQYSPYVGIHETARKKKIVAILSVSLIKNTIYFFREQEIGLFHRRLNAVDLSTYHLMCVFTDVILQIANSKCALICTKRFRRILSSLRFIEVSQLKFWLTWFLHQVLCFVLQYQWLYKLYSASRLIVQSSTSSYQTCSSLLHRLKIFPTLGCIRQDVFLICYISPYVSRRALKREEEVQCQVAYIFPEENCPHTFMLPLIIGRVGRLYLLVANHI